MTPKYFLKFYQEIGHVDVEPCLEQWEYEYECRYFFQEVCDCLVRSFKHEQMNTVTKDRIRNWIDTYIYFRAGEGYHSLLWKNLNGKFIYDAAEATSDMLNLRNV